MGRGGAGGRGKTLGKLARRTLGDLTWSTGVRRRVLVFVALVTFYLRARHSRDRRVRALAGQASKLMDERQRRTKHSSSIGLSAARAALL